MKKLIYLCLLALSVLGHNSVRAQVSLQINIGSQPLWGPTGYEHVDYYYLPEIESYYDVPGRQFVYLSDGNWVRSNGLPPRYAGYNLYRGYKVVLNSPEPYRYYSVHKVKYAKYRTVHTQPVIRYSKDTRYDVIKSRSGYHAPEKIKGPGRPGPGNYSGAKGHGNGPHKGGGKGHGKH